MKGEVYDTEFTCEDNIKMTKGINMTASSTETRYHRMEWDDELAAAAQRWSKKCNPFEEEPIGNVGKWNSVGRNSVIQSELAEFPKCWIVVIVHVVELLHIGWKNRTFINTIQTSVVQRLGAIVTSRYVYTQIM
ncbi:LOW QUALITY PROTEIN: venom allergen-like (VAL) 3 protein [Schistosoma mansoni]|uniref:venom allergen-like (VAL) 3 protein n=1 Tax=Schistosoma mansoni TaxID=6183 RepID=UPI00022DC1B7|nr:LOW QUALITY PROTEIN: venom allergen-like (VAL) 3 protein [Schistosoma mansoni]|eukprot:XP_018653268.1 LOW QUALITY PROTEIN: venom allergen-like (VAL) 3 protein [Schistosoma mansoni]